MTIPSKNFSLYTLFISRDVTSVLSDFIAAMKLSASKFFFLGGALSQDCEKRLLTASYLSGRRLSVRPSPPPPPAAWNMTTPTERIFNKFDFLIFLFWKGGGGNVDEIQIS